MLHCKYFYCPIFVISLMLQMSGIVSIGHILIVSIFHFLNLSKVIEMLKITFILNIPIIRMILDNFEIEKE